MNFPKHTCTEIYGAFLQTWFWLKCRFTGLWLHMPVERLGPEVCSIPSFHSVQQNINSLLKYFPYIYMYLSVLAHDQVTVCIATKNLTEGISAYAYLFMSSFFQWWWWKVGHERWKKWMIWEGVWGGKAPQKPEHFDARKRKWKSYLWPPPLWIHKWNFDPPPHVG